MTVYYVGRGGTPANTQAFPPGFKMISGDPTARSYDSSTLTYLNTRPVADRVSFRCINEANDIPEEHYLFRTDCVNGMRAQINFQSCWDGVNLYLEDSAHVAYVSGIDHGSCPPSHPVPIPGLFFEVLYFTNQVDQSGGGEFVFSNGDATGYGFHADFVNGWHMDVQDDAVKNCLYTDDGGIISACKSLAASQDVNFARNCPQQPSVFNEKSLGTLDALPGCNPITHGPASVEQETCPVGQNTPNGPSVSSQSSSILVPTTIESTSPATSSSPSALPTAGSTSSILPTLPTSSASDPASVSIPASTDISTATQSSSVGATSGPLSPSQDSSLSLPGLPTSMVSTNSAVSTLSTSTAFYSEPGTSITTVTESSALVGNTDTLMTTVTSSAQEELTSTTTIISYTTITITVPFGRAGNFFAVTSDAASVTQTAMPGLSSGVGGLFTTITGATTTTFLSDLATVIQTAVPSTESSTASMGLSSGGGGLFTITGATTTTFLPDEATSSVAEETSTTTIWTTITLYETVTPTSTRTIELATATSQSVAAAATTTNSQNAALTASVVGSETFISSTVSIDNALGCSLYSEYSLEGCATSPSTGGGAVATAFVTVTSPVTEEITSTTLTTLLQSTAASNTTFFTIRGRAFTLIG